MITKQKVILLKTLLLLVSLLVFNCKNIKSRVIEDFEVEQDTLKSDLNMKMLTIRNKNDKYIVSRLKRNNKFYDSIFNQSLKLFFEPYYSKHKIDSLGINVDGALQELIIFKNKGEINYLTVAEFLDKDPTLNNDVHNKITYKLYNSNKDSIWSYIIENTKEIKSKGCNHLEILITDYDNDSYLELNIFYEKFYGGEDPNILYYILKNNTKISKIYDYEYLNDGDKSFNVDNQLQKMTSETRNQMKNNWRNYLTQRKE